MISICLPTRNRPELFSRLCKSVLETIDNPDNVEFSIYRDEDDTSEYQYAGNYTLTTGKRIWAQAGYNEAQKAATGPIFMFTTDDTEFLSKGWDTAVQEVFDNSGDKIIFPFLNDGYFRHQYGVTGAVHRNWVDTVGYFFNPELRRAGDVVINQIARHLNRKAFLKDYRIRLDKIMDDPTHIEYEEELVRTNHAQVYKSSAMKQERLEKEKRLLAFIDGYKYAKTI
jgi:hypothetical protein